MITMALYAFTKVTLAIINLTKARRQRSSAESALRSISLADALVSIASLQRSMLVSFGEMTASEIRLFNILTGSGVCILVFILGLNLLMKKREDI
jgi:divalent metal cation (Fe/Co/Zn/Cd) transporter